MATQSEASFNCIWLWEEGMPGAAYWAEIFVYRYIAPALGLKCHRSPWYAWYENWGQRWEYAVEFNFWASGFEGEADCAIGSAPSADWKGIRDFATNFSPKGRFLMSWEVSSKMYSSAVWFNTELLVLCFFCDMPHPSGPIRHLSEPAWYTLYFRPCLFACLLCLSLLSLSEFSSLLRHVALILVHSKLSSIVVENQYQKSLTRHLWAS